MKQEFEELQNPPKKFIDNLVKAKDEKVREAFLSNTIPLNNSFAFASIKTGPPCPPEQMGGRMDTCKINGNLRYLSVYFLKKI